MRKLVPFALSARNASVVKAVVGGRGDIVCVVLLLWRETDRQTDRQTETERERVC